MLTALVGTGKKVAFIESKLTLLVIQKQLHYYVIILVLYVLNFSELSHFDPIYNNSVQ